MNRFYFLPICALFIIVFTATIAAETMYIKTIVNISLRTGPGKDYKITSAITSGDPIDVLETSGEWSKIRTLEGKEGWMESVLITAEKPSQFIPVKPISENMPLNQQANILEENKNLKRENMRLEAALSASRKEVEQLQISLKEQTAKDKGNKSQMVDKSFKQNAGWFFLGAGAILIGFILGYNVKRPRSRSLLR